MGSFTEKTHGQQTLITLALKLSSTMLSLRMHESNQSGMLMIMLAFGIDNASFTDDG